MVQKINSIQIPNDYTFNKLNKLLKNKKPTPKTVLLLRLYTEQNITVPEMKILINDGIQKKKTAKSFIDKKKIETVSRQNDLFKKIIQLDRYKNSRTLLIDKMKGAN